MIEMMGVRLHQPPLNKLIKAERSFFFIPLTTEQVIARWEDQSLTARMLTIFISFAWL